MSLTKEIIMSKLTWLLRLVGAIQLILGLLYLTCPGFLLTAMGHSNPEADIYYPLAMLAARFIAFGVAFIYIATRVEQHSLWINFMILIQAIDLAAGIFYTSMHIVPLSLSGFPMFNAIWIIVLLWLWHPKNTKNLLK
jgi:hypothetical protein